jgi:hypothetical protein
MNSMYACMAAAAMCTHTNAHVYTCTVYYDALPAVAATLRSVATVTVLCEHNSTREQHSNMMLQCKHRAPACNLTALSMHCSDLCMCFVYEI